MSFWRGAVRTVLLAGILCVLATGLILIVCLGDWGGREPTPVFELLCPDFGDGETIPVEYTADGENVSPPLEISGAPEHTVSFAIIMDDPDAPGGTFTHWLIWNIGGATVEIPAQIPNSENVWLENGEIRQGVNDFGRIGYSGPDPPAGNLHHYRFRAFALDSLLELKGGATRSELESAMEGHVLGQGILTGIYQR